MWSRPNRFIGTVYYRGCKLGIVSSVTSIGDYAFCDCDNLTEVVIGNGVESIGNGAFYYCDSLTKVVIGNAVTSIGFHAFYSCDGLTEIVIPDSVTNIGSSAFYACFELTGVYYQGTIETWCNISFDDSSANPLYYAKNLYLNNNLVTELVIPEGATEIKAYAFYYCSSLTSVVIPDSVTTIGNGAFDRCSSLTEIVIPDSVTSIGNSAFYACRGLTEFVIPDNVTSIGDSAFCDCDNLTEIIIPDNVTSIGDSAFCDCDNLTGIVLPNNIISIGNHIFSGCSGLTEIVISNSVTSIGYAAFSGCSGLTEIVIPDSVTTIGDAAFSGCSGLTEIVIPDNVTTIGDAAFSGCSGLTEIKYNAIECEDLSRNNAFGDAGKNTDGITVTIGASVKKIPANLFSSYYSNYYSVYKPKITHIVFEEGSICESIGEGAFRDCDNLTELVIPDSVMIICESAFSGCTGLTALVIPDSVTSIGEGAFYQCSGLTKITLPFLGASSSATSASDSTLFGYIFGRFVTGSGRTQQYYSSSESVSYYIPPSLQSVTITGGDIFYGAFYNCWYLTEIVLPDGVTNIAPYAFYNCVNLTKIVMPENITTIGYSAFSGCTDLTDIVIPNGVTSIGGSAFSGCNSLTKIIVPDSVTSIGSSAFFGCSGLKEMTLPFVGGRGGATSASNSTLFGYIFGENAFDGGIEIKQYYSSSSYSYSTYYIPTGLQSVTITGGDILYGAFSNCSNLTNVAIGEAVTSISDSAFDGCDSLVYSEYSNAYYLGNDENEFYALIKAKNTDITRCIMNDGTGLIADRAFYNCSGLTEIVLPDGVTNIGAYAFFGCSGLTEIIIPNGVTSIRDYIFSGCTGLMEIVIPDNVTSIGNSAFYQCSGLTQITLPFVGASKDGMSNTHFGYIFGANSYSYNDDYVPASVKKVTITSVTSISKYAFYGCSSLTAIVIPAGVTTIGNYAFYTCSGLTKIVIPDSVTSIGFMAFDNCSSLTRVYYKGTAEEWSVISIGSYNTSLTNSIRYYYSETAPALNADGTAYDGNYWHYDKNGNIVVWVYTKPEE
ncbi:MAG: leucine-rich repeat domain-containing protein [Clostridia bacterium]|nr:leucine-rich repeat domain-containing protein [Clostridia bacterium]